MLKFHKILLAGLFIFLSLGVLNLKSSNFQFDSFRLVKSQVVLYLPGAKLLGLNPAKMPSYKEGMKRFLDMIKRHSEINIEDIEEIKGLFNSELKKYLEPDVSSDASALFQMAISYKSGKRRDQVTIGEEGDVSKMLRYSEIGPLISRLKDAVDHYYSIELGYSPEVAQEIQEKLDLIAQMAEVWVTGPISSKSILEGLKGGKTAIMAINAQITASIPGNMLEAMKKNAQIMFEIAMSESNLEGGYTGQYAKDYVDAVRYYAFLLGFDLPYDIHADHTTVKEDTWEAVDYAIRHNQAQLHAGDHYPDKAGFTSFAEDPSSVVAVNEKSQLEVLNNMNKEDLLSIPGIGEVISERILNHGEFKKLKELTEIPGMNETKINNLLEYIESKILVEILNNMGDDAIRSIPRVSNELADKIIQKRNELGGFDSLKQLQEIPGVMSTLNIEGISQNVTMFDYLKTYLDLDRVIVLNHLLSLLIPDEFGLENEVGHIGRADPFTGRAVMTTPLEAVVLIEGVRRASYPELIEELEKHNLDPKIARAVYPDLLATNNGTVHGNVYVNGKLVPTSVDIQRTEEIAQAIRPLGVEIAQHGVTGTPFDTLKNYLAGLILKANVGTQWRNIALQYMPEDLFKDMVKWTIENKGKPGQFDGLPTIDELTREEILEHPVYAPFISKNIKYSIKIFKDRLDSLTGEELMKIINATRQVSAQYLDAFNAINSIWKVLSYLGWNGEVEGGGER